MRQREKEGKEKGKIIQTSVHRMLPFIYKILKEPYLCLLAYV